VEVRAGTTAIGEFTVEWRDGRAQINRDEELMLELIADAVGDNCARVRAREEAEPQRVISLRR
jgi:UDP-GlcNAc:undecaprenyl-phosphate GlcNAc-1-phosphate transferase